MGFREVLIRWRGAFSPTIPMLSSINKLLAISMKKIKIWLGVISTQTSEELDKKWKEKDQWPEPSMTARILV